jgi:hypothetical protein
MEVALILAKTRFLMTAPGEVPSNRNEKTRQRKKSSPENPTLRREVSTGETS